MKIHTIEYVFKIMNNISKLKNGNVRHYYLPEPDYQKFIIKWGYAIHPYSVITVMSTTRPEYKMYFAPPNNSQSHIRKDFYPPGSGYITVWCRTPQVWRCQDNGDIKVCNRCDKRIKDWDFCGECMIKYNIPSEVRDLQKQKHNLTQDDWENELRMLILA